MMKYKMNGGDAMNLESYILTPQGEKEKGGCVQNGEEK